MFNYIKRKLGILDIEKAINRIPALNDRYLSLLTPLESFYNLVLEPEGDDSMVMHKLRCMGLCGGWKIKEQYEKGKKHGNQNVSLTPKDIEILNIMITEASKEYKLDRLALLSKFEPKPEYRI